MQKIFVITALVLFSFGATAQNHVSNIRVQQLDDHLVVMYDLVERADIEIFVSFDGGTTFRGPLQHVSGAVGRNIAPEPDKTLVWNVLSEFGSIDYENVVIKIVANPVSVEPLPPEVMLTASGRKVYHGGRELSRNEVRDIMANSDALRLYNKGIKRNRNGNIWNIGGFCLIAGGAAVAVIQPFERRYYYTGNQYYDRENNTWRGFEYYEFEDQWFALEVGGVIAAAGAAMILTGSILKMSSKIPIRKSVNLHNSGSNTSNLELDWGFTGNGVRLAIRF